MRLRVHLQKKKDDSYEIIIGKHLENAIAIYLKKLGKHHLIVTHEQLASFAKKLSKAAKAKVLHIDTISFKEGEQHKNINTLASLAENAHLLGLDRKSAIIALGGGIVGDVAGFLAAVYMRGIPYIQVPTTLLAMVDASIGGKTGINLKTGKNMLGSFYQPKRVFIDIGFLKTLPQKEFLNGIAEVIKYGCILDDSLFRYLEKHKNEVMKRDWKTLIAVIKKCCLIKAAVVEKDETESGLRKILNFGHTIGHALETITSYKALSHGQAIAIGMATAAKLSVRKGMLKEQECRRIVSLIKDFHLPTHLPTKTNLPPKKIIETMAMDKKAVAGITGFVLIEEIGKARYDIPVANKLLVKCLR